MGAPTTSHTDGTRKPSSVTGEMGRTRTRKNIPPECRAEIMQAAQYLDRMLCEDVDDDYRVPGLFSCLAEVTMDRIAE